MKTIAFSSIKGCTGKSSLCILAAEAVRFLRKNGRRAARLAEGRPEWRDAGLLVETPAS